MHPETSSWDSCFTLPRVNRLSQRIDNPAWEIKGRVGSGRAQVESEYVALI